MPFLYFQSFSEFKEKNISTLYGVRNKTIFFFREFKKLLSFLFLLYFFNLSGVMW